MDQYILIAIILALLAFQVIRKYFGIANKVKITPEDAKSKIDKEKDIVLLDVRTKNEYLGKHIPKSTLIPIDILSNEVEKKLPDKNKQIIVYCSAGNRSARAVRILDKLGYVNIHNLGALYKWPYKTVSGK